MLVARGGGGTRYPFELGVLPRFATFFSQGLTSAKAIKASGSATVILEPAITIANRRQQQLLSSFNASLTQYGSPQIDVERRQGADTRARAEVVVCGVRRLTEIDSSRPPPQLHVRGRVGRAVYGLGEARYGQR